MNERPILFTAENAQKVHDGRKTQTRRIITPQPEMSGAILPFREMAEEPGVWIYNGQTFTCPYGTVGDRLRVAADILELTVVRVEKLNDISECDAIAEGVTPCGHTSFHVDEHTCSFKALWASINGEESWQLNPWVWCLSFRTVSSVSQGGG